MLKSENLDVYCCKKLHMAFNRWSKYSKLLQLSENNQPVNYFTLSGIKSWCGICYQPLKNPTCVIFKAAESPKCSSENRTKPQHAATETNASNAMKTTQQHVLRLRHWCRVKVTPSCSFIVWITAFPPCRRRGREEEDGGGMSACEIACDFEAPRISRSSL